jgi:hypothetical protein
MPHVTSADGARIAYTIEGSGPVVILITGSLDDAVAVYETPYDLAPETPQQQRDYVAELDRRLLAGRRGDAVALFMELAGSSPEEIAAADALENAVPGGQRRVLDGQGHVVDPAVMAAELKAFFDEAIRRRDGR